MRKILLLIVIVVAFIGCSKDDGASVDRSCWVDVRVNSNCYDVVNLYAAAFAVFPHVVNRKFWADSIRINGEKMNENMQGYLLYRSGEITDTVAILRINGIDPRGFRITATSSCINLAVRTFVYRYIRTDNFTADLTLNANGKNGRIPQVVKYIPDNDSTAAGLELQKNERVFGYFSWTDQPFNLYKCKDHFDCKFFIWINAVGKYEDGNYIEFIGK